MHTKTSVNAAPITKYLKSSRARLSVKYTEAKKNTRTRANVLVASNQTRLTEAAQKTEDATHTP